MISTYVLVVDDARAHASEVNYLGLHASSMMDDGACESMVINVDERIPSGPCLLVIEVINSHCPRWMMFTLIF